VVLPPGKRERHVGQSENPGMIAYTYTTDVSGNEVKTWLSPVKYIKDGKPHIYTVSVNVTTVTNSHFAGNLRADEGNPESCQKHFLIESIKIGYIYSAL
jgi:hypothetical protein